MNTSWKEKTSIFGIRCGLALVVGLAKVMKPALDIVLSYKQKWQNELNSVFDNVDIPLKNIQTIDELKKITVRCIACNKTKELCNCCGIEQKLLEKNERFSQEAVMKLCSHPSHSNGFCHTCGMNVIGEGKWGFAQYPKWGFARYPLISTAYVPSIQTNEMKQEYIDTSKTQKQVSKKAPPKKSTKKPAKKKTTTKTKKSKVSK